jgi:uncharacterized membrane protein
MKTLRLYGAGLLAALLLTLAACELISPDFTLSLNPTSLSVQQGSSGTTRLTITPQNGFTGTVNLSLVGAPNGVTLSPTSVSVTGSGPVARDLTLSVGSGVATGTYTLQVRATSGGLTKTANLSLTVTAAPDFTLSLNPTSLSVQQGSSGTTRLTITPQNGFTGTVNLSLVGAPNGVTLSPTSVSVTGSGPVARDLTLSVGSGVATGTYTLQVRATSGGLTKTANLSLTVTAAPDFTLSLNPTSLSVQQGSSGTTRLTITPQNGFTGTVNLSLVDGSGNPVPDITLDPTNVNVTGSSPVTRDLTVNVGSGVATGTYTLQVRATSGGLTKTANLSLTVSAPGGGGGGGAGTTWTVRNLGDSLFGVTYGNGLFVAVGGRGTILTSPDGVTWTPRASGTDKFLFGVAHGNGLFVAVGWDGTILTSPDGVSWTPRASLTA